MLSHSRLLVCLYKQSKLRLRTGVGLQLFVSICGHIESQGSLEEEAASGLSVMEKGKI